MAKPKTKVRRLKTAPRKVSKPAKKAGTAVKEMKNVESKTWSLVSNIIPHIKRLLLYGPSGTGKTYAATLLAQEKDEEVFQITLTPDTPAAALIGHYIIKGGGTVWNDGVGMAAWRAAHKKPSRLVINEVDHAGPDAISALHVLLDDQRTARMSLPTGETLGPGPLLRIIGTMNGVPEDLLPSLQDRFTVRIPINEVAPGAIAALPEDLRTVAINTALCTDPQRRISVRSWNEFAVLRPAAGEKNAADAVFGDKSDSVLSAIKLNKK